MKKIYTQPELEVLNFRAEDIMLASAELPKGIGGDNETEILGV